VSADASFESSARGLREVGASADERDLVTWIIHHAQQERELLERYEEVLEQATSPSVRYLVNLILDDERRHHRVLAEIAEAIAWGILPTHETALPRPGHGDADLVAETKALLASERHDRAELRRLRRRLARYSDTMWPLLVDVMAHDTDKHIRILEYVVARHAQ